MSYVVQSTLPFSTDSTLLWPGPKRGPGEVSRLADKGQEKHFQVSFRPQMPNAKKNTRRSKRGKRDRKRRGLSANNLPPPPYPRLPLDFHPGPIVNRQLLIYTKRFTLTEGAAGGGQYYQFRINDIYDPDYTGAGISATGYSTWAYFYSRFKVLRTRVHVEIINNSGQAAMVGCFPQAGNTFTSNPTYWAIQPFARSKTIEGYQNGGPNSKAIFDWVVDHSAVFGVTKQQYLIDQDYGASFGASPARSTYLTCFIEGYGGAVAASYARVIFSFDVELSQPLHTNTN